MHRSSLLFQALLVTGVTWGSPLNLKGSRNEQIQWKSCDYITPTPVLPALCANLTVPLDYADNSSQQTWTLEVMKVPALKGPSKGSVFVNYGGPGLSGLDELAKDFALYQMAVTGGHYDLVNIVPRGTGFYRSFQCWNTSEARTAATKLISISGTASNVAQGNLWAGAELYDENCYEAQSKLGPFIGTAFVARDIAHVATLFGEPQINYWGISYGTLLGQTLADMFPERVNRLVLDGNVNGYEYYNNTELEMFTKTDATFAGFCKYCAAAPKQCLLAQGNRTAEQIEATVYELLEYIKTNPIPIPLPQGGALYDYTTLRGTIINALYTPYTWSTMDATIYSALTRNSTALLEILAAAPATNTTVPTTETLRGTKCGDSVPRVANLSGIQNILDARYKLSKIGGDYWDPNTLTCARWKMAAKERVLPKLSSKVHTNHPILLLNNRYDPVTSISSAHNTSDRFEGSVVLETIGYGHGSTSQGSLCAARLTQAYFMNGTLPKPDTICDVIYPYFTTNAGLKDIITAFGFANYSGSV